MEDSLNKPRVVSEKESMSAKFSAAQKTAVGYLTQPIVKLLARMGTTPNSLSWLGFWLTVGAVALILSGQIFYAGFVVLIAGFFDMLDGALARATNQATRFGAVLDSTLDRISEGILFLGIAAFYVLNADRHSTIIVLLASITMIASFMVSYVRARAEGVGLKCDGGWFTRAKRLIVLVLGLLLSQIDYVLIIALAIIAVVSSITVGQRLSYVWQQTRKNG